MSIHIFHYFDEVYCINLDSRPDRWSSVLREFKKIGIEGLVKRFPAISTPQNGHLGCMLSHRAIVAEAASKKWKNVLVFEDDVIIVDPKKFIEQIADLLKVKKYDIAYFGGLFIHPKADLSICGDNYFRIKYIYGAHAIVYTSTIYDIFLKLIHDKSILEEKYITFDAILAKKIQPYFTCIMPKNLFLWQKKDFSNTEKHKKGSIFLMLNRIGFFTAQYKTFHFIHFIFFTVMSRIYRLFVILKNLFFC